MRGFLLLFGLFFLYLRRLISIIFLCRLFLRGFLLLFGLFFLFLRRLFSAAADIRERIIRIFKEIVGQIVYQAYFILFSDSLEIDSFVNKIKTFFVEVSVSHNVHAVFPQFSEQRNHVARSANDRYGVDIVIGHRHFKRVKKYTRVKNATASFLYAHDRSHIEAFALGKLDDFFMLPVHGTVYLAI